MCLALNYAQAQEQVLTNHVGEDNHFLAQAQEQVLTDLLRKDEFGEQDLLGQPGPYNIAPMNT